MTWLTPHCFDGGVAGPPNRGPGFFFTRPTPEITNVYVDAFNRFYARLKGTASKWLNLRAFCERTFPSPRNRIATVRYFTAQVTTQPGDPDQPKRQEVYPRALRTLPNLTLHFGTT